MSTNVQQIPTFDPPIEGNEGKMRKSWILFLQTLLGGDSGQTFTPIATNLTGTGTPTLTGAYFSNQGFIDFWIKITPGVDTSSVAGTTYIDLPFAVNFDTGSFAAAGVGAQVGAIEAATRRLYPPTWTGITVPITLTGRVISR
jgi:hypothetical protein